MPAIAIGVAVGFAASIAVSTGFAIAIGLATAIVTDKYIKDMLTPSVADTVSESQSMSVGNPKPYAIVGETVVSGDILKYERVTRDEADWHHFYLTIAVHPCESIDLYQLDGKLRSDLSSAYHYLEPRLGNQTGPTARSLTYMSNVDETFIGTNASDVYCEFVIDQEVWPNGVQDVKFIVKGVRCYDPRKDSTQGGIGAHRLNDSSTWEWTDNAALVNFWWKKFNGAKELPDEMFDLANIAEEATICDEDVTVEDSQGNQSLEKRYTCNGVLDLTNGYESNEAMLLKSCGGRWIEGHGQYRLQVAAYRGPAIFTITSEHLAGKPKRRPFTPLSERYNLYRGTFVDKSALYQSADMTPIESETLRDERDDGETFEGDLQLHFTQTDSMSQRLGVIELLRNAAGDIVELPLHRCYANMVAGKVVYVDLPQFVIQGTYEINSAKLNPLTGQYSLQVQETSAAMYNQLQTPPDYDATPNLQLDNSVISPVNTLVYTATPENSYRQGVLTWSHPAPNSVKEYLVTIEQSGALINKYRTIEQYQNVVNLPVGTYTAIVAAKNSFDKPSEALSIPFNVAVTSTPTGSIQIEVLPGRVIITGPAVPNPGATYEWRYDYDFDFENAFYGGLNTVLTVTNTPHNGTLYVWYRLVDGDIADPTWVAFSVPNLIGVDEQQLDPTLVDTIRAPLEISIDDINDSLAEIVDSVDTLDVDFREFKVSALASSQQEIFSRLDTDIQLIQTMAKASAADMEFHRRMLENEELTGTLVYRDNASGQVIVRAYQYTDDAINEVLLELDAVDASLTAAVERIASNEESVIDLSASLALLPGQITATATAIVSESIAALAPAHAFNFFDSAQDWVAVNGTLTPGTNQIALTWGDFENDSLNFSADDFKLVRVTLERTGGTGWDGTVIIERDNAETETFTNYIDEPVVDATTLNINFQAQANFTGTINRVRLILGQSVSDTFTVSAITIGKADATTQDLANITARVSEVELKADANESAISQRVTLTEYNANAITQSNVEAVVNGLDSVVALTASYQQLVDEDTVAKANNAAVIVDGFTGTIVELAQTLQNNIDSNTQQLTTAQEQINAQEGKLTEQLAGIQLNTFATADETIALLNQLCAAGAKAFDDYHTNLNFAFAINELQIITSPTGSIAKDIESLQALTISNGNAISATNTRVSQVETDVSGQAEALEQLQLDVNDVDNQLSATIDTLEQVSTDLGNTTTALQAVQGAVNDGTTGLEATFNKATQAQTTATNANNAATVNANAISQVQLSVQGVSDLQDAEVLRLDAAEVNIQTNTQGILTTSQALSTLSATVNNATTGLGATYGIAQAAKTTAEEADGKADANAESITLISNAVNNETTGLAATNQIAQQAKSSSEGNASAITQISTRIDGVETDADAALSLAVILDDSLDALRAYAQLGVDVNGNAVFIQLDATPNVSEMKFQAGKYKFVDENGVQKIFWNATKGMYSFEGELVASILTSPEINGGTITGSAFVSKGTSYMTVNRGTPFGPHNLIEWYGPISGNVDGEGKVIFDNLTKVNAISWKDDAGNELTTGTIIAGTLTVSKQNPELSNTPQISTGSFGSNGGQIAINCSFFCTAGDQGTGTCPAGIADPTLTLKLYRIAPSGTTLVSTQNYTGDYLCLEESGEFLKTWAITGSFTFYDNLNTTTNREYRLDATLNDVPLAVNQRDQRLSILTQEA